MPETGCAASQSLCMYMHCAIFKTCICYNFNLFYIFNKLKKCCYISMKTQISTEEGTNKKEDMSLLFSEIFDSLYQSTVFCRLNTVCTNSCEKPWRQNGIMTELQHLLHWTLFVWRKGLCSANKSPLLLLSHATMTPQLPQHYGQSKNELPTS